MKLTPGPENLREKIMAPRIAGFTPVGQNPFPAVIISTPGARETQARKHSSFKKQQRNTSHKRNDFLRLYKLYINNINTYLNITENVKSFQNMLSIRKKFLDINIFYKTPKRKKKNLLKYCLTKNVHNHSFVS